MGLSTGVHKCIDRYRRYYLCRRAFKADASFDEMPRVPFVGRLYASEYVVLAFSFIILLLEFIVRFITLALPTPVLSFFYNRSRAIFKLLPSTRRSQGDKKAQKPIVRQIHQANGFVEMCALFGYEAEEHIVQTKDGYLLGLHRIPRGADEAAPKRGEKEKKKLGVVYLHHGLLMNSEVWVCNLEREKCLPFVLAEKGFDVWLGNNRGNKYSKKSIYNNSQDPAFWNFSMDEFAMHDIPDSIEYILNFTKSRSLSYIGFSQGTAQAFATLSIHPDLNEVVDVFIALAPAMSPAGLSNGIVDAMVKASPNVIFLFFGRKSILSSTMFWQSVLYPPIFVRLIDASLKFLFNWTGKNITAQQKLAAYAHLYSFTSVKSVVHWFQIIRNRCFQMYDDDLPQAIGWYGNSFYKVAKFPTKNIKTPIVLLYGGSDSLVDISVMLKELPNHTEAKEIPHYEHLDFLWGDEVDKLVIPDVLESLENYSDSSSHGAYSKEKRFGAKTKRFSNPDRPEPPSYSEDERLGGQSGNAGGAGDVAEFQSPGSISSVDFQERAAIPLELSSSDVNRKLSNATFGSHSDKDELSSPTDDKEPHTPTSTRKGFGIFFKKSGTSSPPNSNTDTPTGTQSPWPNWLMKRSSSFSSTTSAPEKPANPFFGSDGLKVGVGKPAQVSVIVNTLREGEELIDPNTSRKRRKNNNPHQHHATRSLR